MYALIRKGNGQYYGSTVFGYYTDAKTDNDGYSLYYVVLNEEKTKLVRCFAFQSGMKYINKMVLITDGDQKGWQFEENGAGGVSFLPRETADGCIDQDHIPAEILDRCLAIDNGYVYNAYPEIRSEKDIDDLNWVSQYFHDAYIEELKMITDDELYVRFDGVWGCKIEIWFSGDLEYDVSSRDPDTCDPYWSGSTTLIENGFVYLIDDDDMTVDRISEGYCWFKARKAKYHVIPE